MALTKQQKDDVVADINNLLQASKMTVVAAYKGTTVKAMQQLRRNAKDGGTSVRVIKNRLVIKAMQNSETHKNSDTNALVGQLLYAFNDQDEVAPAQSLAQFAKENPNIEFIGAYSADGSFLGADEVKALAMLPSKPQLIAEVIATLSSPVTDVMSALSGNLHALLDGVEAKATN